MKVSYEAKLGAFVVGVALAFAFLIITFGEIPLFRPLMKSYIVYFTDVVGLSVGAEVRVAGIKSGKVKSISLEEGRVKVVFEINRDIVLYKDASAEIGTLGLMGDKYLSIRPGTPNAGILEEGGVINQALGYADTDKLIKEMTDASEALKILAQNFQLVLAENREDIRQVIQNLEVLTYNLNQMSIENRENLRGAIYSIRVLTESLSRTLPQTVENIDRLAITLEGIASENRQDIKEIVKNLREVSQGTKDTLPELVKNLNELSKNLSMVVSENREDLRSISKNLSDATENLNLILSRIEKGEGTLGKLIKDDELYKNITSATRTFSQAGEVAKRTNLYIGFRGELYKDNEGKGILTIRLQPDDKKYYLMEVVGNSKGKVTYEETSTAGTVIKKEFTPQFTLQYARIFPIAGKEAVFRAGLKESEGGVGFDLILNRNTMIFSDFWDFGRRERLQGKKLKPNLQVGLQYNLKGPVYARVGGDDLLNDRLRGGMVGVGVLFTDNDLKYLLGTVRLPFP
ncbi:MlaD family protein [Thermocrinis sp.]